MFITAISSILASALITSTVSPVSAPIVWSDDSLRVSHAAEVIFVDRGLTYLETDDGNVWGVYGKLDASRLYAVVFDNMGTNNIEDDRVLLAVAMD
nr:MAG TPA: hypothetical protein [Caudoviricetes sp.]